MAVHVIDTIKPKNNLDFPVVEAANISGLAYVTPQMYGAAADGLADDTQAIQQAVNQGGVVFFPRGTYKVTESIIVNSAIEIIGEGSEASVISGELNDYIFSFGTTPKRWYPSFYKISKIGITNTGAGGTIKFDNATQSRLSDCRLAAPQYSDQNNLVIANESHWIIIENNFIIGGNGVEVDANSNGVTITNNYVTYCNNAIKLKGGGQHKVIHNDVEGYNKKPYIIGCSSSEIECWGERNKSGNWIEVTGNYNIITVAMFSDGGSFYKPLLKLSGSNNKITIKNSSGYTIFEGNDAITGEYNEITIQRCRTLTNRELMKKPESYLTNTFIFGNQDVLITEYDDITQFVTNDPSDYTYDPDRRIFTLLSDTKLEFDFSSVIPENVQGYLYFEATGISFDTHGKFIYSPAYNSVEMLNVNERIISLSGYTGKAYPRTIESEIGIATQAFKINKLRLSLYLTNKLIDDIDPPEPEPNEDSTENVEE